MVGVRNDYLLHCFDLSTGTAEKVKIRKCCFMAAVVIVDQH